MSKIVVEYDSVTKEITAKLDGKDLGDVESVSIWCGDDDCGVPGCCNIYVCGMEDEENNVESTIVIRAEEGIRIQKNTNKLSNLLSKALFKNG